MLGSRDIKSFTLNKGELLVFLGIHLLDFELAKLEKFNCVKFWITFSWMITKKSFQKYIYSGWYMMVCSTVVIWPLSQVWRNYEGNLFSPVH